MITFASCSGQGTRQVAGSRSSAIAGHAVSAIDTSIWYIFQDRKDNYWFGSNGKGVYRYDGKNLTHFSTKDGLCHDQIRGIQEDSTGNIYFNTVDGISKFDGTFTTLKSTRSNGPGDDWRSQPGDLWFAGAQDSGVVYRYDGTILHRLEFPKTKNGEEFIRNHPRSKYPNARFSPYDVYSIYRDRKGSLWFGTNIGLCRYDPVAIARTGSNAFGWISEEELGIDDIAIHVRSTFEDKNGSFWFTNTMHRFDIYPNEPSGNENGSISFRKEKGIVGSKDHGAAYFMSSVEDNNGDMWMVTFRNGAWRYDGKKLTQYVVKAGNESIMLFSIYKDRQGGLWLATPTAGAYKFNGKTFEKFRF